MKRSVYAVLVVQLAGTLAAGDFTGDFQNALRLHEQRKHTEAYAAFVELAGRAPTDGSKSDSLRYAVLSAVSEKEYGRAQELLAQIPRVGTRKLCEMDLLLAQGRAQELVDRFGSEDLMEWPDIHILSALLARAQAYRRLRRHPEALADLVQAEGLATTPAKLAHLLNLTGAVLLESGDDERALATYRRMDGIGSLKGYGIINDAVISAARILAREGKYEEALREMNLIPLVKSGYWHTRPLMVRAEILAAQGRKAEALTLYAEALQGAADNLRDSIRAAMEKLR